MTQGPGIRRWLLRAAGAVPLLFLGACGELPEETEAARGVAEGANIVLVLTVVFVFVAGGIVLAAVAYDRYVRSQRALEEAEAEEAEPEPEDDEEEQETEVAGIGMGTGGVPRWLYAAYVIIPVFAFLYVVTNVQVAEAPEAGEEPATTEGPDGEPGGLEIAAENIQFDTDELVAPANTEITLTFHNEDSGVPHNVAVYESDAMSEEVFVGETFDGVATETYTFETPGPGEYYFVCDVHPNMNGAFVVEEAESGEADDNASEGGGAGDEAGGAVEVTAENVQFDTDELTVRAGAEVELTFHNEDAGVPHNVAVYETDAMSEEVFVGETFDGVATETYTFTAPEPGEYYFVCDVHPNMNGTFVVEPSDGG